MPSPFSRGQQADFSERGPRLPLAILCFIAGPMVVVIWFVLAAALWQRLLPLLLPSLAFSVFAAWKLVRLGRRLKVPSARQILENDRRPPVLYLRSFESDTRIITKPGPVTRILGQVGALRSLWAGWSFGTRRIEEQHTKILRSLGPVIALSPPGQRLPHLGAARIAFEDHEWQDGVRDLMQRSQLIVIEGGVSSGLKWEMSEAFQLEPFKPILICAPPIHEPESLLSRQKRYEMLKRALPNEAVRLLPEDLGNMEFFLFKTADQVRGIEGKGELPKEVLDEVATGNHRRSLPV